MKRNKLAICDPEREYAYRLTDALSRREDLPFEILTFTSVEKLEESLAQGPIQLLMIAQSVFLPERKNQWKVSRILLLWDPGEIPLPGFAGISKYSGVSRILKKMMKAFVFFLRCPPMIRVIFWASILPSADVCRRPFLFAWASFWPEATKCCI